MNEPKKTGWPGFKYVPVPEIVHRRTMRTLRTARRDLQRFFETSSYPDFAARLAAICANPRNGGEHKLRLFEALQNDYIAEVRKRQGSVAVPSPVADGVAEAEASELPDTGGEGVEVGVP